MEKRIYNRNKFFLQGRIKLKIRKTLYLFKYKIKRIIKNLIIKINKSISNSQKNEEKIYPGNYLNTYKNVYYPSVLRRKKYKISYKKIFLIILFIFFFIGLRYIKYSSSGISYEYFKKFNKYLIEFSNNDKQKFITIATNKLNFRLYNIKRDDNFWKLAKENNINVDSILGCNPYLDSIYASINQEIIIPDNIGVIHLMGKGENIHSISKLYDISLSKIKKYNKLQWWRFKNLNKGDTIFIPKGKPKVMTKKMAKYFYKKELFVSPISGAYTSGFGWRIHPIYRVRRFHKGLDISVKIGTPVCAAADGVVVFSGWMKGYGKLIRIRHINGYMTGYGHLSRYYVKPGNIVKAGQIIGKSGNTGVSTGPHLDFTIFKNNRPVNPALYLW